MHKIKPVNMQYRNSRNFFEPCTAHVVGKCFLTIKIALLPDYQNDIHNTIFYKKFFTAIKIYSEKTIYKLIVVPL